MTNFDVGNGERMRKWRDREEMEREGGNGECHSLFISSFSLHFLAARLQGSSGLRNPVGVIKVIL